MEGKTATSLKGKISPEHTASHTLQVKVRPIASEIRAKTTGKTRQSGTVHSTVHTVHHSKG